MKRNYSFINILRALAVLWVLLAHCFIWGSLVDSSILPNAKIAVDLFMFISGFLMMAITKEASFELQGDFVKQSLIFYIRRFFRIAPCYYLSLFLAVILSHYFLGGYAYLQSLNPLRWGHGGTYDPDLIEYGVKNVLWHVSFLFGLSPTKSFSTFLPDWSLSLEMQFYFVFPFVFALLSRFKKYNLGLIICTLVSFCLGLLVSHYYHFFREPSFLFLKFHYFLAGIVFFKIKSQEKMFSKYGLLLFSILLCSSEFYLNYKNQHFVMPCLVIVSYLLFYFEDKVSDSSLYRFIYDNRLINITSELSFGIYLFHGFFISLWGLVIKWTIAVSFIQDNRFILMLFFVPLCSFLTSYIINITVEKPFIALGTRFINAKLK